MKIYHYLGVGIRLFSIWLFLFSITQLGYFIENIVYGTVQGMDASAFISGLIYIPWLAGAILLWVFPLTLAKKIVPPDLEIKPESITPNAILSALISAIALFLLHRSIMDGVYWATFWNIVQNSNEMGLPITLNAENKASVIATSIELFVAALLFFNCRKIAKFASKF